MGFEGATRVYKTSEDIGSTFIESLSSTHPQHPLDSSHHIILSSHHHTETPLRWQISAHGGSRVWVEDFGMQSFFWQCIISSLLRYVRSRRACGGQESPHPEREILYDLSTGRIQTSPVHC
jgi:hypothetical protein